LSSQRHVELIAALTGLAQQAATSVGVEVVEVSLRGSTRRRVLRVDIDRVGASGVTLDDCQHVSHVLGEILDQTDILQGGYVLEVSSPGVDRPIRTLDDVRRNTGRRVRVEIHDPVAGQREVRGLLVGGSGSAIRLRDDAEQEIEIPLSGMVKVQQDVHF